MITFKSNYICILSKTDNDDPRFIDIIDLIYMY